MKRYSDCPQILKDFLTYHETIKGQSQLTISEYYLDLRMFLRFIKLMRNDMPIQTRLDDIDIRDVSLEFISKIDSSEVFDFLSYLALGDVWSTIAIKMSSRFMPIASSPTKGHFFSARV